MPQQSLRLAGGGKLTLFWNPGHYNPRFACPVLRPLGHLAGHPATRGRTGTAIPDGHPLLGGDHPSPWGDPSGAAAAVRSLVCGPVPALREAEEPEEEEAEASPRGKAPVAPPEASLPVVPMLPVLAAPVPAEGVDEAAAAQGSSRFSSAEGSGSCSSRVLKS
jgi:hypothetical protein